MVNMVENMPHTFAKIQAANYGGIIADVEEMTINTIAFMNAIRLVDVLLTNSHVEMEIVSQMTQSVMEKKIALTRVMKHFVE